jgi:hypothetical protein
LIEDGYLAAIVRVFKEVYHKKYHPEILAKFMQFATSQGYVDESPELAE